MHALAHVLTVLGLIQLLYAIYLARKLAGKAKYINLRRRWLFVEIFLAVFLVSHIGFEIVCWHGDHVEFDLWSSSMYFFGATFVLVMLLIVKRAFEALALRHKIFMDNIFNTIEHPLFVFDVRENAVALSNEAAKLPIVPGDDITFDKVHTLCAEAEGICPIEETKSSKNPVSLNYTHRVGESENYYEINTFPIKSVGGIREIIVSIVDITERIQSERDRSVHSMIVTYNHEINNPLTIALGTLELQMRNLDDIEQTKESMFRIKEALKRISGIVKKISEIGDKKSVSFESYSEEDEMLTMEEDEK